MPALPNSVACTVAVFPIHQDNIPFDIIARSDRLYAVTEEGIVAKLKERAGPRDLGNEGADVLRVAQHPKATAQHPDLTQPLKTLMDAVREYAPDLMVQLAAGGASEEASALYNAMVAAQAALPLTTN